MHFKKESWFSDSGKRYKVDLTQWLIGSDKNVHISQLSLIENMTVKVIKLP